MRRRGHIVETFFLAWLIYCAAPMAAQNTGVVGNRGTCANGSPRLYLGVDSANPYAIATGGGTDDALFVCRDGAWDGIPSFNRGRTYSAPDNTAISMFTVALPTQDTGCFVHISYASFGTNATDTYVHGGEAVYSISNDDGVVTGTAVLLAEVVNGAGCVAGCDTNTSTVASTTYTGKLTFNNTLSVTGTLNINIVYTTCGTAFTVL